MSLYQMRVLVLIDSLELEFFITCGKHLHDRIIALKGMFKTSLTPSPVIEVPVQSRKRERSCACVLRE